MSGDSGDPQLFVLDSVGSWAIPVVAFGTVATGAQRRALVTTGCLATTTVVYMLRVDGMPVQHLYIVLTHVTACTTITYIEWGITTIT